MPRPQFKVRTGLAVLTVVGLIAAISQQEGPWLVKIVVVLLLANSLAALIALVNAGFRFMRK